MTLLRYGLIIASLSLAACKKKEEPASAPEEEVPAANQPATGDDQMASLPSGSGGTGGQSTATGTAGSSGAAPEANATVKGYYLGYDGQNDFSIILPGFRTYKIADSSLATIKEETANLSEATLDAILAAIQKERPEINPATIKPLMPRQFNFYRITPLKPGQTTITLGEARRPPGVPERPAGSSSGSGSGGPPIEPAGVYPLKIYNYARGQVAEGKSRYTTRGSGNLRACTSCHAGGEEGAPPHELGRVMTITDTLLLTWITTGSTGTRTAKIQHTWEFSSARQKAGVPAYLRTLQSRDMETLIKLMVDNLRSQGF